MSKEISEYGLMAGGKAVSLQGITYQIKVAGPAAEITIIQHYKNTSNAAIEAVYVFPKNESATVIGLIYETEDQRIVSKVDERDAAFKTYDNAMAGGDSAVLLDAVTRDLLQLSVGNVNPGQAAVITLTLVAELTLIDNRARLFVPLSRFPRYARSSADPIAAEVQNSAFTKSAPYGADLFIASHKELYGAIASDTHTFTSDRAGWDGLDTNIYNCMALHGAKNLSTDLECFFSLIGGIKNSAIVSTHGSGARVAMVTVNPEFDSWNSSRGHQVIFFIDCSGSMEGSPIDSAKHALECCLRSLGEDDSFKIVCFGSGKRIISDKDGRFFKYSEASFETALHAIKKIEADMGGTELFATVDVLLADAQKQEQPQDWVLLTDGGVTDPESVVKLVASAKNLPRIFTLGIGSGASTSLLEGLARVSGGSCEMVLDNNRIEEIVLRQFSRIDQPHITNIKIDCGGVGFTGEGPLPEVFEGDGWRTMLLFDDGVTIPEHITFTAQSEGNPLSIQIPVIDIGCTDAIGALWAGRRIKNLLDGTVSTHSNQKRKAENVVKTEVIELSKRFHVMCELTSLVGVEIRSRNEKSFDRPVLENVPSVVARERAFFLRQEKVITPYESDMDLPVLFCKQMKSFKASTSCMVVCESVAAPMPAAAWYIDILDALSVEGWFDWDKAKNILTDNKIVKAGEMKKFKQQLAALKDEQARRVLVTGLVVALLEKDTDAKKTCKMAICKAKKWMKKIE